MNRVPLVHPYIADNQISCRMSWFLVELPGPPKSHCIIHSVDIVGDSRDLYIDRQVEFQRDHKVFTGTLICASDDRSFIEDEMRKRISTLSLSNGVDGVPQQMVLVQYNKGESLVHTVIRKSEVLWILGGKFNARDVFITDADVKRLGAALYMSDDENEVLQELDSLKTKCFDGTFEDSQGKSDSEKFPWLLIQYSAGPSKVIYSIVNYNDTVWRKENLYKDVVAYVSEDETVFQGLIVKKSHDREELEQDLKHIKESCLLGAFANNSDCDSGVSSVSCAMDYTQQKIIALKSCRN